MSAPRVAFAIRVLTFSQSEGESNGRPWHFAARNSVIDMMKEGGEFLNACQYFR